MTNRSPKSATEWLLAFTRVHDAWVDVPADQIIFAILDKYAPLLEVELVNPASFYNPTIKVVAKGATLRAVFEDICRYAFVTMEVTDQGAVRFRNLTAEEMFKSATLHADGPLHRVRSPTNGG